MLYKVFGVLVCIGLVPFVLYGQSDQDSVRHNKNKGEHHSIGIGIKAGFNFANVTKASSINANNRAGYHFGLLLAPFALWFILPSGWAFLATLLIWGGVVAFVIFILSNTRFT